jgi:hypothetical protein
MTDQEAKEVFSKVCQETGTDSIISDRATGGGSDSNMFSFDRANITREFIVSIYGKSSDDNIVSFPVSIKISLGGKSPSSEEISKVANIEVAKAIVSLSPSSQFSQKNESQTLAASNNIEVKPLTISNLPKNGPLSIFEIQQKLVALGYNNIGIPDGIMGKKTISGLIEFLRNNCLYCANA